MSRLDGGVRDNIHKVSKEREAHNAHKVTQRVELVNIDMNISLHYQCTTK